MTDNEILEMARTRTNARVGFYIHVSVFAVVMIGLFSINYAASPDKPWSIFPFLGWGLGVAIHGVVSLGVVGSGMKDRMLREELARIKIEQGTHG